MPTETWAKPGRAATKAKDASMFRISFLDEEHHCTGLAKRKYIPLSKMS